MIPAEKNRLQGQSKKKGGKSREMPTNVGGIHLRKGASRGSQMVAHPWAGDVDGRIQKRNCGRKNRSGNSRHWIGAIHLTAKEKGSLNPRAG